MGLGQELRDWVVANADWLIMNEDFFRLADQHLHMVVFLRV
jgi:sulfur relay (sulfurtransferase) DsrC/TusE family protein